MPDLLQVGNISGRVECAVMPNAQYDFEDSSLFVVPPGRLDGSFMYGNTTLSIKQAPEKMRLAVNSGAEKEAYQPADSLAIYPRNTELTMKCENVLPRVLLDIGAECHAKWLEPLDLDRSDLERFIFFEPDLISANTARALMELLNHEQPDTSDREHLMIEALISVIAEQYLMRLEKVSNAQSQ